MARHVEEANSGSKELAYTYEYRVGLRRLREGEAKLQDILHGKSEWSEQIEALLTFAKTLKIYQGKLPQITAEESDQASRFIVLAAQVKPIADEQRKRIKRPAKVVPQRRESNYHYVQARYVALRGQLAGLRRAYPGADYDRLKKLDDGRKRIVRECIALRKQIRSGTWPELRGSIEALIERAEQDPRIAGFGAVRIVSGGLPTLGRRR